MKCCIPLLLLLCSRPFCPKLHAQVDQEHWVISDLNHGYNTSFGLQQEFTPKLDAIDSAEFSIGQSVTHPVYVYPGTVALNLREGGIDGRVLAASNPVFVPAYYSGNIVFSLS